MPLLVGESIAAHWKECFHKLQTDRSVGTVESYLPASEHVKRQSLHIFAESAVAGNQNVSPISARLARPRGSEWSEWEHFEDIFCTISRSRA